MTVVVSTSSPIWSFENNAGTPLVGGKLFSYLAGTVTPAATYVDSTGTQANSNPILLNAHGDTSNASGASCGVWIPPNTGYKFILQDTAGNTIWSIDNYFAPLSTLTGSGAQLAIQQTPAEVIAGVVPTNTQFPPLNVFRYGNVGSGNTDDSVAFNSAFAVAAVSGGTVVIPPPAVFYLIQNPLNLTPRVFGGTTYSAGYSVQMQPNLHFSQNSPNGSIRAQFAGGHLFDMTGNIGVAFYDLCITTDPNTFPATCFFVARVGPSLTAPGNVNRMTNCRVFGSFSNAIYYDYGGEDDILISCFFFNYANLANTRAVVWTANNVSALTSTFQTVAPTPQSCLHHHIMGGNFQVVNPTASSDVFYFEQASFIELDQPWVACPSPGRSIVFADTTNAASNNVTLLSLETEAGVAPSYGVNIPNPGAGTPTVTSWTLDNCYWDKVTNVIGTGSNITLSGWRVRANTVFASPPSAISIQGTLQYSTIDCDALLMTIVTDHFNTLIGSRNNWTITNRTGSTWLDPQPNGASRQWTPTLNSFTTSQASSVNTNSSSSGGLATVTLIIAPNGGNVICTGGTATITGMPFINVGFGTCIAVDQTTNVVLGTGYVSSSGIFPPTLNSAHNVIIVASYFAM